MEPVEGRKGREAGGSVHGRELFTGRGFAVHPRRAPLRRGRPEPEAAHVVRRVHLGERKRVVAVPPDAGAACFYRNDGREEPEKRSREHQEHHGHDSSARPVAQ